MTQTTNYGLNVVEGSDTVNLLTQMNPNTEAIDAQMKTNEDHGIQEATELFTSTVHAITRLRPDAKVFRFTAVSNYTAGETFTVDGVQVTALLTSGEALTTGSFIIGSEVICALRDTLLTVFVNAGTASVAKNAEKLGGELPSYYGTAEDVADAVDNAGTALETANAVSGAVGNLSALTTTDKSSCVGAINSVNENLTKLSTRSTDEMLVGYDTDGSEIYERTFMGRISNRISIGNVLRYDATLVPNGIKSVVNVSGNIKYPDGHSPAYPAIAVNTAGLVASSVYVYNNPSVHNIFMEFYRYSTDPVDYIDYNFTIRYVKE